MSVVTRFNYYLDKSCSLLVGSAVAIVDAYCVLHFPTSVFVPVFTANACFTAGLSKGLKRVFNQSRPVGAPKLSPGMPSNHATSLSFLCVSTTFGLQRYLESALSSTAAAPNQHFSLLPIPTVPDIPSSWIRPLQGFLVGYSVYLSGLRVVQGHHTLAQVLVGYAFGTACASLCLAANYWGYAGDKAGGRVDDLSFPAKTAVVLGTTLVALFTARSVFRGAKHARMATTAKPPA